MPPVLELGPTETGRAVSHLTCMSDDLEWREETTRETGRWELRNKVELYGETSVETAETFFDCYFLKQTSKELGPNGNHWTGRCHHELNLDVHWDLSLLMIVQAIVE